LVSVSKKYRVIGGKNDNFMKERERKHGLCTNEEYGMMKSKVYIVRVLL